VLQAGTRDECGSEFHSIGLTYKCVGKPGYNFPGAARLPFDTSTHNKSTVFNVSTRGTLKACDAPIPFERPVPREIALETCNVSRSAVTRCSVGVPQDSVLGQLLFAKQVYRLYTGISLVCTVHRCRFAPCQQQQYADGTQLCVTLSTSSYINQSINQSVILYCAPKS